MFVKYLLCKNKIVNFSEMTPKSEKTMDIFIRAVKTS